MGAEYIGTYIEECGSGGCDRPATVRVHNDFVLCALHHHDLYVAEEINAVEIAFEMLPGWRSEAEFHGATHLAAMIEVAERYLTAHAEYVKELPAQTDHIERENVGDQEMRRVERARGAE